MHAQGIPVSLGAGANVGGNFGIAALAQAGITVGFSINGGTQVGGGRTHSKVTGNQGSVTQAELWTVESQSKQHTESVMSTHSDQQSDGEDRREVERIDKSPEVRKAGVEVHYAGTAEDIIIASVEINELLRGSPLVSEGTPSRPLAARDSLRVRVDHLPSGIIMDVEFRGLVVPRAREG